MRRREGAFLERRDLAKVKLELGTTRRARSFFERRPASRSRNDDLGATPSRAYDLARLEQDPFSSQSEKDRVPPSKNDTPLPLLDLPFPLPRLAFILYRPTFDAPLVQT